MASIQPNLTPLNELNNVPVLNPDTLAQIKAVDGGNLGLTKEMFNIFKTDTPIRLSAIQAAIKANDTEKVRKMSHAIKGSCGTMGIMRVKAVSAMLEAYAKGFKVEEPPDKLFERLKNAYLEVCEAMESYLLRS